jgi:hypothetical protein
MATETVKQPAAGSPNASSTTKAGIPFHPTSTNYADAQAQANTADPIRIPDGRRNSQALGESPGENEKHMVVASGIHAWFWRPVGGLIIGFGI